MVKTTIFALWIVVSVFSSRTLSTDSSLSHRQLVKIISQYQTLPKPIKTTSKNQSEIDHVNPTEDRTAQTADNKIAWEPLALEKGIQLVKNRHFVSRAKQNRTQNEQDNEITLDEQNQMDLEEIEELDSDEDLINKDDDAYRVIRNKNKTKHQVDLEDTADLGSKFPEIDRPYDGYIQMDNIDDNDYTTAPGLLTIQNITKNNEKYNLNQVSALSSRTLSTVSSLSRNQLVQIISQYQTVLRHNKSKTTPQIELDDVTEDSATNEKIYQYVKNGQVKLVLELDDNKDIITKEINTTQKNQKKHQNDQMQDEWNQIDLDDTDDLDSVQSYYSDSDFMRKNYNYTAASKLRHNKTFVKHKTKNIFNELDFEDAANLDSEENNQSDDDFLIKLGNNVTAPGSLAIKSITTSKNHKKDVFTKAIGQKNKINKTHEFKTRNIANSARTKKARTKNKTKTKAFKRKYKKKGQKKHKKGQKQKIKIAKLNQIKNKSDNTSLNIRNNKTVTTQKIQEEKHNVQNNKTTTLDKLKTVGLNDTADLIPKKYDEHYDDSLKPDDDYITDLELWQNKIQNKVRKNLKLKNKKRRDRNLRNRNIAATEMKLKNHKDTEKVLKGSKKMFKKKEYYNNTSKIDKLDRKVLNLIKKLQSNKHFPF